METGETFTKTAADQIAIAGVLDSGAVAAIHYRGGLSRGVNFLWEINGSDLQLTAENGQLQMTSTGLLLGRGDATNLSRWTFRPPSARRMRRPASAAV